MIDFTKRNLYDRERKKLNMFKDNILVKESDRDSLTEFEDDSGEVNRIEATTVVGSEFDIDGFDSSSGFGDFSFGDDPFGDSFGSSGGESEDGITERGNLSHYQTHMVSSNKLINFLVSPFFLVWYVILHITRNNMKVKEWENELQMVKKVNILVIATAVLFLILEGRTIISPWIQLISGVLMLVGSIVLLKVLKGEFKKKETEEGEGESVGKDDPFGGFGFNSEGDNDIFGGDSLGYDDTPDFFSKETTFEDDMKGFDNGENDFFDESPMEGAEGKFPSSPLVVTDDDEFGRGLTEVFKSNKGYTGTGIKSQNRKDMLYSFAPYMATNYTKFGEWKVINETSISYMNIAFTIFLALEKVNNSIGRAKNVTDEFGGVRKEYSKMYVNDIKENTMMYRIEIELPEYFTEKKLTSARDEFYNMLKASENDTNVKFLIATFGGGYVIKLFKPSKDIISFGDMLRYNDPTSDVESPLDQFLDEGKGLPVLLGLKNNEFPVIVDYEDNTSGAIVGGSGSGKSWATFYFLANFLTTNDYHNLQMVVFDKKNAPFWNAYALTPHVVGYHHKTEKLLDICKEVYDEIERRKELLNEVGAENFKGYRKKLRKKGNYDEMKRFPLLLFVVDEITSTMNELYEMDEDQSTYKSVRNIMAKITQEGRSLGVRMLVIGQRSIDTSIPKNVISNASFKFGMKLDNTNDFNSFDMEQDVKKLGLPTKVGEGIMRSMGEETAFIKTLGVGGTSDEQILNLIRAMSLEWNRRSIGDEFVDETTNLFKVAYNRDKFRDKAMDILSRGELLPNEPNQSIAVDVDGVYSNIEDGEYTEVEEESYSGEYEDNTNQTEITSGINTDIFNIEEDSEIEVREQDVFNISNEEDEEDEEDETDSFNSDNFNFDSLNDLEESEEEEEEDDGFGDIDFDSIGKSIESKEQEWERESESLDIKEEKDNIGIGADIGNSIEDKYDFENYVEDEDDFIDLEEEEDEEESEIDVESEYQDIEVNELTREVSSGSKPFLEEKEEYEDESEGGFESNSEDYELEEDEDLLNFAKKIKEEQSLPSDNDVFVEEEDEFDEGFDDIGAISLADEEFNNFEDMDFTEIEETTGDIFEDISNDIEISNQQKVKQTKPKEENEEVRKPRKPVKKQQPVKQMKKARKPQTKQVSKPSEKPTQSTETPKRVQSNIQLNQTPQTASKGDSSPRKRAREPVKGGVMFDPGNVGGAGATQKRKSNKGEVAKLKRYILENGINTLTQSKVLKSELREHFNGHVIGDALDSGVIYSKDEDHFVTRI